jgi:hypothetical protein
MLGDEGMDTQIINMQVGEDPPAAEVHLDTRFPIVPFIDRSH